MTARGRLTIVGTGFQAPGHVTQEGLSALQGAEKLFHLVQDTLTHHWLEELNPTAESLYHAYRVGRPRRETYDEIVARILEPLDRGVSVCVALYGHPGVFVTPSHEAIRRARAAGHEAAMLPGISAEDCLIADLGFDPGASGCQSFEATDFLVHHRRFDTTSHLILWQIGAIGVSDFRAGDLWSAKGLALLAERLIQDYGTAHDVVIYEVAPYSICEFKAHRCPLAELASAPVTLASTLYVPPLPPRASDPAMRAALGMPPE